MICLYSKYQYKKLSGWRWFDSADLYIIEYLNPDPIIFVWISTYEYDSSPLCLNPPDYGL